MDTQELESMANGIKMILMDVDGVLTDGGIVLGAGDFEAKRFDVQDGMGIVLARRAGLEVGIITGRVSEAVRRRCEELSIERVFQGYDRKTEALAEVVSETGYEREQLAYVGDDVTDVPIMKEVGLALAPANARPEVKEIAHLVAEASGGRGAVRELVDRVLELRGEKEKVYRDYVSEKK